jgi:hypothetical protein
MTSCQDKLSSLSSFLVLLGMRGLYNLVVVVEWVFAAYMLFGVVSAVLTYVASCGVWYICEACCGVAGTHWELYAWGHYHLLIRIWTTVLR